MGGTHEGGHSRYGGLTLIDYIKLKVLLMLICNYRMHIIGYDSIKTRILSLSNSHNNAASIQKNWGDESHHVNVALLILL